MRSSRGHISSFLAHSFLAFKPHSDWGNRTNKTTEWYWHNQMQTCYTKSVVIVKWMASTRETDISSSGDSNTTHKTRRTIERTYEHPFPLAVGKNTTWICNDKDGSNSVQLRNWYECIANTNEPVTTTVSTFPSSKRMPSSSTLLLCWLVALCWYCSVVRIPFVRVSVLLLANIAQYAL